MRVYAETNWLLDLVFQQERFVASSFVLSLAEERKIDLCLPEIIVWEGNQKVERRNAQRGDTIKQMRRESREFGRSQDPLYQFRSDSLKVEIRELVNISDIERGGFDQTITAILPIVTWLHLSQEIWGNCLDLQDRYAMKRTDALIYAVIRADAALHPNVGKCFIDYDRIFDTPGLK
ncbi:hypothetical protein HYR99_13880, partial [Candidatus Poribacteria bacterium]|nr:hypothetical protein [Candidatus Poribacteria bacterium]